jgi:anaerobic magnesium-protoporphyrin IX monomethyl ester cyclase
MAEAIDILFINPGDRKQVYQNLADEFGAVEPPVFAGLFAAYARAKGARVAIYDAPALMASAEMAARAATDDFAPKLVVLPVYGFQPSASTHTMSSAGKIASRIKETRPDLPILMTGTHPAALPERTLQEEAIDFVCDREGPATIVKTLEAIKAGTGDFANVPSLWWRDEGRIRPPGQAEALLVDLDREMPGVAWDLLPMERYRAHNWHCFAHIDRRQPYASIHTSLGCPYSCSFCCINAPFGKPGYRMWSPQAVVAEIDHLVERYGVKNIKIVDEMFVLNKRHVAGICDLLIARGHDLNIWAYGRVDTVEDEALLAKLKKAGFHWLCLGIESASDHVRDGAKKKFGNDDITAAVRRVQAAGIRIIGNYVFGLPDDSLARMQETLDLALELNCEFANFYSAMAYPGSKLYERAKAEGRQLPAEWHHYSQHGYETLPLSNRYCDSADILGFRDRAWTTYFTHPPYLDMVRETFGPPVIDHIARMVAMPLKRKILGQ